MRDSENRTHFLRLASLQSIAGAAISCGFRTGGPARPGILA